MKPSGIGGQAVIEGVMMKNKDVYAVAVRKPDSEIAIKKDQYVSYAEKNHLFKLPIFRGMLAFVESMKLGMDTLSYSSSFYEEEDAEPGKFEKKLKTIFKQNTEKVIMSITMIFSVILALAIFVLFPTYVSTLLSKWISSYWMQALLEGVLRIAIFVGYVLLISLMKDIRRVFMYHGAEHKTINCIEHGLPLTVENVRGQSKQHKRCGTSFMLIVMFFSILFFMFIRIDLIWLKMMVRILLIPIIAGISYEFIRLAGKSESPIVNVISKPGLWLQNLTTREPDDDMIEVAIASVEAVFDWRAFLGMESLDIENEESLSEIGE